MKANNKEMLKKHHFWILFGLVPLFVLIAVLIMSSSVGGAIEKRDGEIKANESAIKSKTNPKSNALLGKMDELIKYIDSKSDGLWKGSYTPQKALYTMPESSLLKAVERKGLKFGDTIPNDRDEYQEFRKKEVYRERYVKLAESVAPTAFPPDGGWERVLRHVNSWTDVKLTSEQIWLMLEDLWVQESLLEAISSVNAQMAEFTRIKFERGGVVIDDPSAPAEKGPSDPMRRKFKSRIWEVELEVVQEGNKTFVKGNLINTTDKLQMFGIGNTMVLRLWLQQGDKKNVQPFDFKIHGEFLPGAGATKFVKDKDGKTQEVPANILQVPYHEDHIIPPGITREQIVAVEQVFDSRTVPIRMIKDLALGLLDSRNAALPGTTNPAPLFVPDFKAYAKDEVAPAADASGQGPGGPGSGGGPRLGGPGGGLGAGGERGSAPPRRLSGGGTVAEVIDGNKKRYIVKPTDQVRRMPIAINVVVDQAYQQDVLLAFANSPIRFQITQVTWNRFRDSLKSDSDSGTFGIPNQNSGGRVQSGGAGQIGSEFGPGGSSNGPPGRPGPGIPPGGLVGPGSAMGGYGGITPASTVSESQLTSGLIELKVYGIVSLYTSPEAPAVDPKEKEAKEKDAKDKDPKDKDAKDKEPKAKDAKDKEQNEKTSKDKEPQDKDAKDKDKEPKAPMTTEPKTKM